MDRTDLIDWKNETIIRYGMDCTDGMYRKDSSNKME